MQRWIYLSPHLDDVAISCGGLVWEQGQSGDAVEIWTICSGDPPPGPLPPFAQNLHDRWQTGREAVEIRRKEDQQACLEVGATYRHFPISDCIYRQDSDGRPLYPGEAALFGELQSADWQLVEKVSRSLADLISTDDRLVSPFAVGHHVDHQLTRAAAESLGRPLWFYADYPYAQDRQDEIEKLGMSGWYAESFPISDNALQAWVRAVAAHRSQISSFWAGMSELQSSLEAYREQMGGVSLWRRPLSSAPK